MNMTELIVKKRDGGKLSGEEIKQMVNAYTKGDIPDCSAKRITREISESIFCNCFLTSSSISPAGICLTGHSEIARFVSLLQR